MTEWQAYLTDQSVHTVATLHNRNHRFSTQARCFQEAKELYAATEHRPDPMRAVDPIAFGNPKNRLKREKRKKCEERKKREKIL